MQQTQGIESGVFFTSKEWKCSERCYPEQTQSAFHKRMKKITWPRAEAIPETLSAVLTNTFLCPVVIRKTNKIRGVKRLKNVKQSKQYNTMVSHPRSTYKSNINKIRRFYKKANVLCWRINAVYRRIDALA